MDIFTKRRIKFRFSKVGVFRQTQIFYSLIFGISLLFFSASEASGQVTSIWSNPITGTNPGAINPYSTGEIKNQFITVSGIGATGISNQSSNDRYNFDNWETTSNINTGKYFSFQITPTTGYKISLSDFVFTGQSETGSGNNAGPTSFALRSNANSDGFSTNIGGAFSVATTTVSLTGANYQNLSNATQFRLYGWNAGSNGDFSINDFTFNGTILGSPTTSLSGFNYIYGSSSSTAQSFSINAAGLSSSVAVLGSNSYEVSSISATTGFGPTANLTAAGGNLTGATIWVRLKPGLSAGNYNETISFGGGGVSGLQIQVNGAVSKSTLTVTANNQTKVYGSANPVLTLSYSGFAGSDTQASLITPPTASTIATPSSSVGPYPITIAGGTSSNYTFNYLPGNLAITPAPLTATANPQNKIYGDVNPAFTVTYSGFVNGDLPSSVTTPPTATSTAVTTSPAGNYPITLSGGTASNYTINYASGTLTINPAVLTITSDNKTKVFGTTNPALTVTYSGFKGTDNSSSLVSSATATTTAVSSSSVGPYPITASGAASPNYTFNYAGGTLTVTKATVSISMASNYNVICQGSDVTLTGTISANPPGVTGSIQFFDGAVLLGTTGVVNDAGTITVTGLSSGSHSLTVKYSGDVNYNVSTSSAITQTVNPRPTAVLSGSTTICKGTSATLSIGVTGSGTFSGTLSDGTLFTGAAPTINVQVSPVVATNYTIASLTNGSCSSISSDMTGSAVISVNEPASITLQPAPLAQNICSGNAVTYTVSATGTGPLTYQWYKGTTALTDGTRISGAKTSTLTLLFVNGTSSTSPGNEYYVKVSGPSACSSVNSTSAGLTVNTEINITSNPAITQTVCEGSPASFTATAEGTGPFTVQWYRGATQINSGVNNVINSANSITTTLTLASVVMADQSNEYYVVISNPSNVCPQEVSNDAALIINPFSAGGTVSSNQTICSGSTPAALTLTGQTGSVIKWQRATVPDFLSGVFDIAITGTTLPASTIGALNTTTYFRAVVQSGVCSTAYSSAVSIVVDPVSVGGTVASNQTICSGLTPADLALSGHTGAVVKWQRSTVSNFASAVVDISSTSGILSGSSIGPLTTTTYVRAVVQSGVCAETYSSPATITITPLSVGGTLSGNQTICSGGTPVPLALNGQTGTVVKWQKSTSSNFSSGISDIAISSATLPASSIGALTATSYFRAVVQSGSCSVAYSTSVTISVDPVSVAGSISFNQTVCRGSTPADLNLSGQTGSIIKWQRSAVSDFSSTITDIAVTAPTLAGTAIGPLTLTTYIRAVVQSGVCSIAYSSPVTLTVDPLSVGGTVSSNQNICSGSKPSDLSLGGQTGAVVKWQRSTASDFSSSSDIASTSLTLTSAVIGTLTATTYFRAIVQSGVCTPVSSSSVTITVNPPSVGGTISANQAVCSGSMPSALTLSGFTGALVKWQKSTTSDFSSSVTDIVSTNSTLDGTSIGVLTSTTYLRALVQSGVCGIAYSSAVKLSVDPVTVPGILSPAIAVGCVGTASGTITLSGAIGSILRWEYSTNAGNAWIALPNTVNKTTYDYTNLNTTTIYRAVVQSGNCGLAYSKVSVIVVDPPYTPVIVATPAITCIGQPVTLTAVGYPSLGTLTGGNFDDANPPGWSGSNANNNNQAANSQWGEAGGPKVFNGVTYNSTSKFMIVNGTTGLPGNISMLSSPAFSTVGLTTFSLTWKQAYNLNDGAVAKVEISIDGGNSYTTLETYTGPANLGPTNGLTPASINLDSYLGRTNLKVRFNYTGSAGSNWAIDDVNMSQTYYPLNYTWAANSGLSSTSGATVTYTPTASGVFDLQVSTTTNSNCPGAGSGTVKVTVNPSPTLSGVAIAPICVGSNLAVKLSGLLNNSTSTLTYQIGSGALITIPGIVADASGNSSFTTSAGLSDNGQTLRITSISSSTSANAVSCSMTPSANNSSVITIFNGYVWTGSGANNLWSTPANWTVCGVPPDGSSVTIPDVSPKHFPKLDVNFFTTDNFDLLGNATIDLNGQTFELGTTTASVLNLQGKFIGSKISNLTIQGGSTNIKFDQSSIGTSNALLNFKVNSSGKAVTLGNPLWVIGNVDPTAGVIESGGNLTMVSTELTSSNIMAFALPTDVRGDVNVQSYITGGGSGLVNRGFRSMSSPINDTEITAPGAKKTFRQMKDFIPVTGPGGTANGFDQGGAAQPYAETITLYNEKAPAFSPSAPSISHIDQAHVRGTGFLAFFRGSQGITYANNFTKLNAPFVTPDPVTITYKGPINKFEIPVSLSYTDNPNDKYNGYNLVGNPYPSAINWSAVGRTANVINTFIIVLPGGKQASFMDGVGNNITDLTSTIIQPCQGFYVRASAAGESITFSEASKSTIYPNRLLTIPQNVIMSNSPLSFGSSAKISSAARVIRLNLQDGVNTDETTLVFKDGASKLAGFEDALYFSGGAVTLGSLSSDEKAMAINGLPDLSEVKEVRLNVNATTSKSVKLNFDLTQTRGYEVFLKDSLLPGKLIDLKAHPVYQFSIDKAKYETYGNQRLTMVFKKEEILPLSLKFFTAKKQQDGVKLSWTIVATGIAKEFEIEQSADGKAFHTIGSIRSQGNSQGNEIYFFTDPEPLQGMNYYRIRQVHINGRMSLSEVRNIDNSSNLMSQNPMILYPNPVIDQIEIKLTDRPDEALEFTIFDIHGRKVLTKTFSPEEQLRYNMIELRSAIYILELRSKKTSKLIGRGKVVKGI